MNQQAVPVSLGRGAPRSSSTSPPPAIAPRSGARADPAASGSECDRLLQACPGGDFEAFAQLYRLSSARVFAVIRRTIWNRHDAEDALQETFEKIWRCSGAFDVLQASALTWMSRVARNHAIDRLRRAAVRVSLHGHASADEDGHPSNEDEQVDASPRPDECLEQRQQRERFQRMLEALPPAQRRVLQLAFDDGLSQVEIAERLKAPLGTVKSWMRRALQQIRASLDAQAYERHGCDG